MPVSVTMPRLGESVTEGTVPVAQTEGDGSKSTSRCSGLTDKVDTEIRRPPHSVAHRGGEDETVEAPNSR
jgi:2-oxoglutarate dehydrogenase E2 component (dihydrolipoamide succinyltransferase)